MLQEVISDAEKKFESSYDHLTQELAIIRSGQTSPALVEDLEVNAYDGVYTLKELAAISIPEPNVILIQPWDQTVIQNIESAITKSNLGISPTTDGVNLRLAIPALSEEKREELAKKVGNKTEDVKIAIRNIRQEKIKSIDNMKDESLISEDEHDRAKKEIQKLVDQYNDQVDSAKEKKVTALKEM